MPLEFQDEITPANTTAEPEEIKKTDKDGKKDAKKD